MSAESGTKIRYQNFKGAQLELPWVTPSERRNVSQLLTQSTIRIFPTPSFCCSSLAAMATELKKQNPLSDESMRDRIRPGTEPKAHNVALLKPKRDGHGCGLLSVVARRTYNCKTILSKNREGEWGLAPLGEGGQVHSLGGAYLQLSCCHFEGKLDDGAHSHADRCWGVHLIPHGVTVHLDSGGEGGGQLRWGFKNAKTSDRPAASPRCLHREGRRTSSDWWDLRTKQRRVSGSRSQNRRSQRTCQSPAGTEEPLIHSFRLRSTRMTNFNWFLNWY